MSIYSQLIAVYAKLCTHINKLCNFMKYVIITLILSIFTSNLLGQDVNENDVIKVIRDILSKDTSEIIYTHFLNPGVVDYNKEVFIKSGRKIYSKNSDTIFLTKSEQRYIIAQFTSIKYHVWKDKIIEKSKRIYEDSIRSYLRNNFSINVYEFSKPIFIRKNTICLVYIMRLCCGDIYGPTHLGFYRKNKLNIWEKWITVASGDF